MRDGRESTVVKIALANGSVMERHVPTGYEVTRQLILDTAGEGKPMVFDGDHDALIVNFANVSTIRVHGNPRS